MRIKNGVRFSSPEMAMGHASMVMQEICKEFAVECVVTGGVEKHQHPSKHVYGGGLDYRTRNINGRPERKQGFADEARKRLGDGFDVVLESDHLHVEWDPKD